MKLELRGKPHWHPDQQGWIYDFYAIFPDEEEHYLPIVIRDDEIYEDRDSEANSRAEEAALAL